MHKPTTANYTQGPDLNILKVKRFRGYRGHRCYRAYRALWSISMADYDVQ
jgi:hypothetical protein